MVLTQAAVGREAVAGDEDEGGGAVGLVAAMRLRRSPGEASARTGCAVTRRCRRCRSRGRSGGDGGARGGGGARWPATKIFKIRRVEERRGEVSGGFGVRSERGTPCSIL